MIRRNLGVLAEPVFCTKIASRLTRTYPDRHGLKDLCKELLHVDLSKQQQSSDWGAAELSQEQLAYAASDVLYLHALRERLEPAARLKPEVASLNMGSMNFGLYEMLGRYKEFKHDWEKPYLAESDDRIFKNTFKDIAHILRSCSDNATRFEIECYDIGHLYSAAHFLDRGLLKPPLFIQSVFGIRGGIGPHAEDVLHMKRTADRLFGDAYLWSVLGAGRNQMQIAALSAVMGGNVRVGLEDSLWIGRGQLARSNAEQVAKVRRILEELGLVVATPDDARQMLKLKGGNNVNF